MNPFDLRGPQFLLFYAVLSALLLGALWLVRRVREADGTNLRLTDPYLIAYLRGGPRECLRLVVLSLVGRGLLEQTGPLVETVKDALEKTRHALERTVLERFQRAAEASTIFSDLLALHQTTDLGRTLERHGLLPDQDVKQRRRRRLGLAVAALMGIALVKIVVALSRGHGNIVYLILMAGVASAIAIAITHVARTARGDAMLADLRTLFAQLKSRAHQLEKEAREEALLLIAVFGFDSLPWRWAFARELFPKAAKANGGDGSWSSSGCGSSCGSSSCGSSGGSSCGGGGCGGGCGGCGS